MLPFGVLLPGDAVQKKIGGHIVDRVLDPIAPFLEDSVQRGIADGTDLEDTGSFPPAVDPFTVFDLFRKRKKRDTDCFGAVGPVRIKVGEAEDPAVVHLHLVGRPGIQR